jgi:hypothetical protein
MKEAPMRLDDPERVALCVTALFEGDAEATTRFFQGLVLAHHAPEFAGMLYDEMAAVFQSLDPTDAELAESFVADFNRLMAAFR